MGNWTLSNGGPLLYSLHLTRIKPSSHRIIPGTLQEHLVNPYTPGSDMVLQVLDQELGSQFYSAKNMCKVYKNSVFVQTPIATWEMISHTSYRNMMKYVDVLRFIQNDEDSMCANCWKVQVTDTRPRTTPSKISQNVWELWRIGRIRLWQMQGGDTYQM